SGSEDAFPDGRVHLADAGNGRAGTGDHRGGASVGSQVGRGMTSAHETGVPSSPEQAALESSPWLAWISSPDGGTATAQNVLEWLERLEAELPEHAAACQDDELRLAALWQHM